MATITKPVVLDETARATNAKLENIAAAIAAGQLAPVVVSGTDPVIVAESGKRYICGEVSSLTFTPASSGACDVIFTSGATATNVLLSANSKMTSDFVVNTNATYELNFLDLYGVWAKWETV